MLCITTYGDISTDVVYYYLETVGMLCITA